MLFSEFFVYKHLSTNSAPWERLQALPLFVPNRREPEKGRLTSAAPPGNNGTSLATSARRREGEKAADFSRLSAVPTPPPYKASNDARFSVSGCKKGKEVVPGGEKLGLLQGLLSPTQDQDQGRSVLATSDRVSSAGGGCSCDATHAPTAAARLPRWETRSLPRGAYYSSCFCLALRDRFAPAHGLSLGPGSSRPSLLSPSLPPSSAVIAAAPRGRAVTGPGPWMGALGAGNSRNKPGRSGAFTPTEGRWMGV